MTKEPVIGAVGDGGRGEGGSSAPLLQVQRLVVEYHEHSLFGARRPPLRAVDDVSFNLMEGETLALVGESGSGKSSVGRAIARLIQRPGGEVRFRGSDLYDLRGQALRAARRDIQVVAQDATGSLDPRMSVRQLIEEPLVIHRIGTKASRHARVEELLHLVGLSAELQHAYRHQISGGQRQRVVIARALALDPSLIVADEATSALDVSVQAQIVNLLGDLQRTLSLSYLFISHNLPVVRHVSHRVAVMYLGKVVEVAPASSICVSPRHPYTAALLSAVPDPDPELERKRSHISLTGEMPSPRKPPAGCRFHTRCWLYKQLDEPTQCVDEQPALRRTTNETVVACHFSDKVSTDAPSIAGASAATGAGL
jgi:oligopeptide/dipeptide ABC transporter ATP-binding protein